MQGRKLHNIEFGNDFFFFFRFDTKGIDNERKKMFTFELHKILKFRAPKDNIPCRKTVRT